MDVTWRIRSTGWMHSVGELRMEEAWATGVARVLFSSPSLLHELSPAAAAPPSAPSACTPLPAATHDATGCNAARRSMMHVTLYGVPAAARHVRRQNRLGTTAGLTIITAPSVRIYVRPMRFDRWAARAAAIFGWQWL